MFVISLYFRLVIIEARSLAVVALRPGMKNTNNHAEQTKVTLQKKRIIIIKTNSLLRPHFVGLKGIGLISGT